MSQEPSYPVDAVPGHMSQAASKPAATTDTDTTAEDEAAEPSPLASAIEAAADLARSRRWQTGVAIGIGSAAVAAALLYANRPKRD